MTPGPDHVPEKPLTTASARLVLAQWTSAFVQVLESMTDQRPRIEWQPSTGVDELAAGAAPLWWEQPFEGAGDALIWIGAPAETWEQAGTLTLKVAGLETVSPSEAQSTWTEILSQATAALARTISGLAGREVLAKPGTAHNPAPQVSDWISISIAFPDRPFAPLLVGFSPGLAALLAAPAQVDPGPSGPPDQAESRVTEEPVRPSRTMDLLLEVELPVSISFGKTRLPLRDVLKLTTGSIVELNRTANDPVDILVNQHLVARGEVVVVEGNYGVRIQEIVSRQDRLRSLP